MNLRPSCVVLLCALGTAACAPLSPNLDSHFGEAVTVLRAQQTINPQASSNPEFGQQDARIAHEAVNAYVRGYRAPTPTQNVFNVGLGSGGSR